jgi:hypothetical protein
MSLGRIDVSDIIRTASVASAFKKIFKKGMSYKQMLRASCRSCKQKRKKFKKSTLK